VDIRDSPVDIRDSPADTRDSLADTRDSLVDIRDSLVDIRDSPVDIRDSPVDIRDSLVDIRDSPVDIRDSPVDTRDSPADTRVLRDPVLQAVIGVTNHLNLLIPTGLLALRVRQDIRDNPAIRVKDRTRAGSQDNSVQDLLIPKDRVDTHLGVHVLKAVREVLQDQDQAIPCREEPLAAALAVFQANAQGALEPRDRQTVLPR
jgi:hypothetical protein